MMATPFGIVTDFKPVQPLKVNDSILVIPLGIVIDVRPVQP